MIGSGRDLIGVLSLRLGGGTEKNLSQDTKLSEYECSLPVTGTGEGASGLYLIHSSNKAKT
jgi:hypothetical protein